MSSSIPKELLPKLNKLGFAGVIIVIIAFFFDNLSTELININLTPKVNNSIGTYYEVTKVVDGDTIHVNIEGNNETVRLIGINTPETVDPRRPVQCFGKEASNFMKNIASGKLVKLEYDDSQSIRDTYNRLLAYVYLEDGQMLNRKMIAEGYAYEYTYMTPYKYQKEFRELQNLARTSKRGLWSDDTCGGSKELKN